VHTTENTKFIKATVVQVYEAFTHPEALEAWFTPGDMIGKVHRFDWREGGGYEMSFFYLNNKKEVPGKISIIEDRYIATLVKLNPFEKIILSINFTSKDPGVAGEMTMEVLFTKKSDGTDVTFLFENIPAGIWPEDNENGARLTLEKLANYVDQNARKIVHHVNSQNETDEQYSDGSANAFDDK
jgi:uncharacterized protein YndB with AHSA1/START domain